VVPPPVIPPEPEPELPGSLSRDFPEPIFSIPAGYQGPLIDWVGRFLGVTYLEPFFGPGLGQLGVVPMFDRGLWFQHPTAGSETGEDGCVRDPTTGECPVPPKAEKAAAAEPVPAPVEVAVAAMPSPAEAAAAWLAEPVAADVSWAPAFSAQLGAADNFETERDALLAAVLASTARAGDRRKH